jgi:hypothetical protein
MPTTARPDFNSHEAYYGYNGALFLHAARRTNDLSHQISTSQFEDTHLRTAFVFAVMCWDVRYSPFLVCPNERTENRSMWGRSVDTLIEQMDALTHARIR